MLILAKGQAVSQLKNLELIHWTVQDRTWGWRWDLNTGPRGASSFSDPCMMWHFLAEKLEADLHLEGRSGVSACESTKGHIDEPGNF